MAGETSTSLTDLVKTGYDRACYFALRPELKFALSAATRRRPMNITNPGTTITWTGYDDLAVATTPLTETSDVTPVAPTTSTKTITLTEYGNAAKSTSKLRGASFLDMPAVDPALADLIGYNAGLTYDTLARTALVAGTNVRYAGSTSRTTIAAGDTLTGAEIKRAVAKLRGASARPFMDMGVGDSFAGFIHPDVAYDLFAETGESAWNQPANYSDAGRRWTGQLGRYHGVMFIESPRAPVFADASDGAGSTGTVDVYATLLVGREALSIAWSDVEHSAEPTFVVGPIVDSLKRFHTVGWKWFGGFGRFRDSEELWRIESSSSIGTNT